MIGRGTRNKTSTEEIILGCHLKVRDRGLTTLLLALRCDNLGLKSETDIVVDAELTTSPFTTCNDLWIRINGTLGMCLSSVILISSLESLQNLVRSTRKGHQSHPANFIQKLEQII